MVRPMLDSGVFGIEDERLDVFIHFGHSCSLSFVLLCQVLRVLQLIAQFENLSVKVGEFSIVLTFEVVFEMKQRAAQLRRHLPDVVYLA